MDLALNLNYRYFIVNTRQYIPIRYYSLRKYSLTQLYNASLVLVNFTPPIYNNIMVNKLHLFDIVRTIYLNIY